MNYIAGLFADEKDIGKINKLDRLSCSYKVLYEYWRENLFERIMRLFIWENTYDEKTRKGVKPKEIESRLIIQGHCGITKIKKSDKEVTAMFGNFFGVGKYIDEKPNYMVRCPIYSGERKIGKDIVVINNNSLRNPLFPLIHHYATLLGHNETTLINILINARDAGGVPIVQTEKQRTSVERYLAKLFNGQYDVVTDSGSLGIEYAGSDRKTAQDLMNVMEVREKLIKSFYSDIGVRSSFEKRNNTVQAEVEADTSLLLLNLSDMLKQREEGANEVNKMFGTNWKVHVAEEIDYGAENQREQFDTATETHVVEDKKEGGNNE